MALRLLLVSVVASLGLTLPGEREVESWYDMAQAWANATVMQWDTHCVAEGGRTALDFRPGLCEARGSVREDSAFHAVMEEMVQTFSSGPPAAPAGEERAANLATSTFEPAVLGDDLYTGTAYVLNRDSEGLDISRQVTGEPEGPPQIGSVAMGEETPADVTRVSGRGETGPDRRLAEAASGRRGEVFEPMVVGDDLYVGVAYDLNRASEGLSLASEGLPSPSLADASPVSRLSVALRLTREAVFAWSNLLHGPAVVAISR